MDDRLFGTVLSGMAFLCSRREYCTADIRKKIISRLQKCGLESDEIAEAASDILARLKKDGYVDDMRYSEAFARDKSLLSGWGKVKIRHALSVRGIDDATISAALAEVDVHGASERMAAVLSAKWRSIKNDPRRREKLLRFALGRGYGYDEAVSALHRLESSED